MGTVVTIDGGDLGAGFLSLGISVFFFWMATRSRNAVLTKEATRLDRERAAFRDQLKEELRAEILAEVRGEGN